MFATDGRCHNYRRNDGLCHPASDVIATKIERSKIYISIVYLWTGRGPEINNGRWRGRARPRQMASARGSVIAVTGGSVRRRSRQAVSRPRVVQFSLTEEEFEEVSRAAERSSMARGAFAAEAALASARGGEPRVCFVAAGSAGGADRGGWARAASRHEPEPGGGETECDRAARRGSASGGTILRTGDPPPG